jgi:hypothetical protein
MMKFKFNKKDYEVKELTIEQWSKLVLLQEWTDEREFSIKLISFATGLTEEEIENMDFTEVNKISVEISQFFMQDNNGFVREFTFNDKKYRFLDLSNLTFGEFIDLDSYLSKEQHEKKKDMSLFIAMLYREVDENGNYKPYNSKDLQRKSEEFKQLPAKYINGASTFFLRLDKTLRGNFKGSLMKKVKLTLKMIWLVVRFSVLISIGLGLGRLYLWLTKILPKSTKSQPIR